MNRVAFITGASGVSGGAILEYLVQHTTETEWRKIIVTARSPFAKMSEDSRVHFIALDFTSNPEELISLMREECKGTTHAYFTSYVHRDDFSELANANISLFKNFLTAITAVAPDLKNVTLQTGGKSYGVHLCPVPTPAREDDPRNIENRGNFYHAQVDYLISEQRKSSWTYNEIRPQAIMGWTPKPNGMNSALTLSLYFMICKELDVDAPMPTNQVWWNGLDDMAFAPLIADLTIYASTTAECANQAFNVSNGNVFRWRDLWPRLASYFGVKASSDQHFSKPEPEPGTLQQEFTLADWHKGKEKIWDEICTKAGAPEAKATFKFGTWEFQDWVVRRSWGVTLNIEKARRYGWKAQMDDYECMVACFEQFQKAGLIPAVEK